MALKSTIGTGCGPLGWGHGKLISLLDVAGTLYAVVYVQGRPDTGAVAVWASPDHGATWRRPAWTFPGTAGSLQPGAFVQFGPGYAGARDRFVYLLAEKPGVVIRPSICSGWSFVDRLKAPPVHAFRS